MKLLQSNCMECKCGPQLVLANQSDLVKLCLSWLFHFGKYCTNLYLRPFHDPHFLSLVTVTVCRWQLGNMSEKRCDAAVQLWATGWYLPWISITGGQIPQTDGGSERGREQKGSKIRKEEGGRRAKIAELIVTVSTRKPSQDSHRLEQNNTGTTKNGSRNNNTTKHQLR